MRVGITNLLTAAGVTVTASSQDAVNWPAENLFNAADCLNPTRTQATGAQDWVFNLVTPQRFNALVLFNVNVASIRWQINSADAWGGTLPVDSGALTVRRQPNGRLTLIYLLGTEVVYQYVRLSLPSQTPVDGAAFYALGGAFIGLAPEVPGTLFGTTVYPALKWNYTLQKIEPIQDEEPDHKGWRVRHRMGDDLVALQMKRLASVTGGPLLAGTDELSAWLELERQWAAVDVALVALRDDNPSLVWMMRRETGPKWDVDSHLCEGDLDLLEAVR